MTDNDIDALIAELMNDGATERQHRREARCVLADILTQAAAALKALRDEKDALREMLSAIHHEAKMANHTISLKRDGNGSGRVKVATAMHRVEQWALTVLTDKAGSKS